jgi:acetyl esterase/lipase
VAYLSLLYPPPGSLHSAVPPQDIAFAGDSSGGKHTLALLQLILQMRRGPTDRKTTKQVWLGREIEDPPLPACVTALSGYLDLTRAMDSEEDNLKYDIIPPRDGPPFSDFIPCEVWPIRRGDTRSPRHHVYANDDALLHPLVSPVTATNWKGSPPTWFGNGEECLVEACMFVAQRMAQQQCQQEGEEDDQKGTAVVFEEFAGMPHNFPLLLERLEASRTCMKHWAEFIRMSVLSPQGSALKTKAIKWSGRQAPLKANSLSIKALTRVNLEELKVRMRFQIKQWGPPPSVG